MPLDFRTDVLRNEHFILARGPQKFLPTPDPILTVTDEANGCIYRT
jgi:hypothetical protein